jgi:AcrR family transcriptional regulator
MLTRVEPVKRKWTVSPERAAKYAREREAIMRAAYRLMGKDRHVVSIQQILDSVGLGTNAFYRHFSSKDELVLHMYRTDSERLAAALLGATEGQPDVWNALSGWVSVSLSLVFDEGRSQHARVLNSAEARNAEGYVQEYLDGIKRSIASLESVLVRGATEGVFTCPSPRKDALVIYGATNAFLTLKTGGSEAITRDEALDSVMNAARRMLHGGTPGGVPVRKRLKGPVAPTEQR